MLVEFERAIDPVINELEGEDDGIGQSQTVQPRPPISINPVYVAAVLESLRNPGTCILRLSDGRGFMVRGLYTEVLDKLRANGGDGSRA